MTVFEKQHRCQAINVAFSLSRDICSVFVEPLWSVVSSCLVLMNQLWLEAAKTSLEEIKDGGEGVTPEEGKVTQYNIVLGMYIYYALY